MIEIDLAWLLALPILFALGWLTAKLERHQSQTSSENHLAVALELGILRLVDGDKRSAILELLALVRLRPDELALQVAIGQLLREVGKIDKAIEVHLAVVTRLEVPGEIRDKAIFELATDYRLAGIIDRATESFQLLIGSSFDEQAREELLSLCQRQKLWAEALGIVEGLLRDHSRGSADVLVQRWIHTRFHLLCELGRFEEARQIVPEHPRISHFSSVGAETIHAEVDESLRVCASCGYYSRTVNWQCPSCFSWDSMHAV